MKVPGEDTRGRLAPWVSGVVVCCEALSVVEGSPPRSKYLKDSVESPPAGGQVSCLSLTRLSTASQGVPQQGRCGLSKAGLLA